MAAMGSPVWHLLCAWQDIRAEGAFMACRHGRGNRDGSKLVVHSFLLLSGAVGGCCSQLAVLGACQ